MGKITFNVKASPSTEWYGTLEVSNIQLYGKPLRVNKCLVVSFKVPSKNFMSVDVWENFGPPPRSEIITKRLDNSILITVYFRFSSSFIFKPENTLTFGVNGDMSNSQKVVETISLTNDSSCTDLALVQNQDQKKAI